MPKTITIDPVTRIEGHGRITIRLAADGSVNEALFHVTQFRGFEKFTEGRPFHEMPGITARICGICPVSHLLASAKACDTIMAVSIPESAVLLRRLLNCAQYVQSHALSFFHLSSPDLLLGMDAPVAERNVLGLAARHPEIARNGIWLRMFGQHIIERLAGKRVHPAWVVPGGVSGPMDGDLAGSIKADLPRAMDIARGAFDLYKGCLSKFSAEVESFANFGTLFLGLVGPDGALEHYDGTIRVADAAGKAVAEGLPPSNYADYMAEAAEPWSYLKSPYFKPMGRADGVYRVGPLARLNVASRCGTPLADAELLEFRKLGKGAVLGSFHYHFARLIEILHALETIGRLIETPEIASDYVRADAGTNRREGVGVIEAPRGTLVHHYRVDRNGLIEWANLIVATGHNNTAMNRGITQAAKRFVQGDRLTEGALNRIEAVIRCYDPCLSCSTHALGMMPLRVDLLGPGGKLLDTRERG